MNKQEENKETTGKELVVTDVEEPKEIVAFGTKAAEVLKDICKQAKLIKNISGKEYMMFEGWQTVGKFFGCTVGVEWTKPVMDYKNEEVIGFEARAYVQDKNGKVISTAESYCGKDESTWRTRATYAIRSMAQTRACAKALRQNFSWVVVLAGYNPTPAEEMPEEEKQVEQAKPVVPAKAVPDTKQVAKVCENCKKAISDRVCSFSIDKYGKPLCYDCQQEQAEIDAVPLEAI